MMSRVMRSIAAAALAAASVPHYSDAAAAVRSASRRALMAETFRRYDYDAAALDHLGCRIDMEDALCPPPEEEGVPCAGLDAVEAYCRVLLGDEADSAEAQGGGEGRNALEGCVNYVSWDEDRLNCCPSDRCYELSGEDEWSQWELVDESELGAEEDEDCEYEYADVLYEEDGDDVEEHHEGEPANSNATLSGDATRPAIDRDTLQKIPFVQAPLATSA